MTWQGQNCNGVVAKKVVVRSTKLPAQSPFNDENGDSPYSIVHTNLVRKPDVSQQNTVSVLFSLSCIGHLGLKSRCHCQFVVPFFSVCMGESVQTPVQGLGIYILRVSATPPHPTTGFHNGVGPFLECQLVTWNLEW